MEEGAAPGSRVEVQQVGAGVSLFSPGIRGLLLSSTSVAADPKTVTHPALTPQLLPEPSN